jgi:hypothetical protein
VPNPRDTTLFEYTGLQLAILSILGVSLRYQQPEYWPSEMSSFAALFVDLHD